MDPLFLFYCPVTALAGQSGRATMAGQPNCETFFYIECEIRRKKKIILPNRVRAGACLPARMPRREKVFFQRVKNNLNRLATVMLPLGS